MTSEAGWLKDRIRRHEEAARAESIRQAELKSQSDKRVRQQTSQAIIPDNRVIPLSLEVAVRDFEAMKRARWAEWNAILDSLGVPQMLADAQGELTSHFRFIEARRGLPIKIKIPSSEYQGDLEKKEVFNPVLRGLLGQNSAMQDPHINISFAYLLGSSWSTSQHFINEGNLSFQGERRGASDGRVSISYTPSVRAFGIGIQQQAEAAEPRLYGFKTYLFTITDEAREALKGTLFSRKSEGHYVFDDHLSDIIAHDITGSGFPVPPTSRISFSSNISEIDPTTAVESISDLIAASVFQLPKEAKPQPNLISRLGGKIFGGSN